MIAPMARFLRYGREARTEKKMEKSQIKGITAFHNHP